MLSRLFFTCTHAQIYMYISVCRFVYKNRYHMNMYIHTLMHIIFDWLIHMRLNESYPYYVCNSFTRIYQVRNHLKPGTLVSRAVRQSRSLYIDIYTYIFIHIGLHIYVYIYVCIYVDIYVDIYMILWSVERAVRQSGYFSFSLSLSLFISTHTHIRAYMHA